MGCGASSKRVPMSAELTSAVEDLFDTMDADGDKQLTKAEADKHFKTKFGHLSAQAMFNEVDDDGNEKITRDEFIDFWTQVKNSGYEEDDLLEEVKNIKKGEGWVDFNDDRSVSNTADVPKETRARLSGRASGLDNNVQK
mmetsp:Transcript_55261/g.87640  ORF Transcript_55261/g.87640 Transcript_55261/m.87640 type:complete len:140 (+) Transcript_55261:94-513(+)